MNEHKLKEQAQQETGMSIEEVKAKYGKYINALEFDTSKVYLLLGNANKVTQRELLWAGRALDKAGIWVIIAMMEPDALRVVELEKPAGEEKPLIVLPDRGVHVV